MLIQNFIDSLINQKKKFACLIGKKTAYSLSPLMHNFSARYHSIDFEYYAVDVEPEQFHLIQHILKHPNCLGFNITIPYKKEILQFDAYREELVEKLGVANVFYKKEDEWYAANTDVFGFKEPLREQNLNYSEMGAFIFGTGGAARAVIQGLSDLGFSTVFEVSRNPVKTQMSYSNWLESALNQKSIALINASPLGMTHLLNESPVTLEALQALKPLICYDLTYNPAETLFLKWARSVGVPYIINGLDMLIFQGSKSFEYWTGKTFPIEEVRIACKKKLNYE